MVARAPSVRWTVCGVLIAIGVVTALVTTTMVALTTMLRDASGELRAAVDNVRQAHEGEIDLLMLERQQDPVLHARATGKLLRRLDRMAPTLAGEEAGKLAQVRDELATYASRKRSAAPPASTAAALHATYQALDELVALEVDRARRQEERAAAIERLADASAVAAGLIILATILVLVWWVRSRALRPLFALGTAMDRLAGGDPDARAQVAGASEVREAAERFDAMARALARRREDQLAYLAGVAHDLRTPLSVLELTIDMLAPDRPLPPEPRVRELVGRIRRQMVRLGRMAGDLTDAARIEAGKLELRRRPHDLREVVAVVVDLFEDTSATHQLEVRAPDTPVLVDGDPLRLEQVLINLLSNAIKYSPAGGRVVIAIDHDGTACIVRVTDPGIGISEAEVGRMFEPFQRIPGVSDHLPGAGLGMWIVRRIVEAHGGRIQVSSDRERGTIMEVRLPCAAANENPTIRDLMVGLS